MKKFIKDDDKLKKEIEKMISLTDIEAMKEIFPKKSEQLGKEREQIGKEIGIEEGIIKTAENMKKEGIDSLIIDVRDNSGGYLTAASDVASLFLKKGATIYSLESKEETETFLDETDAYEEYKTIVLINKHSASASEILAAALRDSYGATLVGETSYGKGKVQQTKTLTDGSMVKYTSAKWLTPLGECIDEVGLIPSIAVENEYIYEDEAQEIIKEIIDKQLPKAIEVIAQ